MSSREAHHPNTGELMMFSVAIPAAPQLTVDDDTDFDDAVLPAVFSRTDETSAADAGAYLESLYQRITDLHHELELIERALRSAAPHSPRAVLAREWVRHALIGFEYPVFRGMDEAHAALTHAQAEPAPQRADTDPTHPDRTPGHAAASR